MSAVTAITLPALGLGPDARRRAHGEILYLEPVQHTARHFVVDGGLRLRITDRDDQRKRLRFVRIELLYTVPRQQLELQAPAVTTLTLGPEVPVIRPDGCPFPELFDLIGLVQLAGVLVLRRNKTLEHPPDLARLAGHLVVVDAEVSVYMGLTVFG